MREWLRAMRSMWRWWWWCRYAVKKSTADQTAGKYTSIILTPAFVRIENHMEHCVKKKKKKSPWAAENDSWFGAEVDGLIKVERSETTWFWLKRKSCAKACPAGGEGLSLKPKTQKYTANTCGSPRTSLNKLCIHRYYASLIKTLSFCISRRTFQLLSIWKQI